MAVPLAVAMVLVVVAVLETVAVMVMSVTVLATALVGGAEARDVIRTGIGVGVGSSVRADRCGGDIDIWERRVIGAVDRRRREGGEEEGNGDNATRHFVIVGRLCASRYI